MMKNTHQKKVKLYAHLKLWGNITTVTYSQKITGQWTEVIDEIKKIIEIKLYEIQ